MTPADTLLPILARMRKIVGRRGIDVSKAVGACFYIL
jgi:hypothetical protein